MRPASLLREAWLNVVTGTARAALLAMVVLAITMALDVADLVSVRRLDDQARDYQASGASVTILSAEGAVDPRLCQALAAQPGVRAAAALRKAPEAYYAALPQSSLPVFEVTPTFPELLLGTTAARPGAGVVLSRDAADAVGVGLGGVLRTTTGNSPVTGIYDYPDDGRSRGYGYAALAPVPAVGAFDECWVDQWPQAVELQALLRGAVVPGMAADETKQVTVARLNPSRAQVFDAHAEFRSRLTAWGLPLAFAATFCVAALAVRLRRLELTAALHLGVSARALLGITTTEAAVWLIPALVAGACTATVYAVTGLREDAAANLALGLLVPTAVVAGGLLGTAAATLSLRERHLFAYFKER